MEEPQNKTRKSVPRPGSGRRGTDGAGRDLIRKTVLIRKDQDEDFKRLGTSAFVRRMIDQEK